MSLRVFVAAPFERRDDVRHARDLLQARGMTPVCSWADTAEGCGSDWFGTLPPADIARIIATNDSDLMSAHAVLMLAYDDGGRESYAECGRALGAEIPVVWLGATKCLTAFRKGVMRAGDLVEAMQILDSMHQRAARPWPTVAEFCREMAWRLATSGSEVAA